MVTATPSTAEPRKLSKAEALRIGRWQKRAAVLWLVVPMARWIDESVMLPAFGPGMFTSCTVALFVLEGYLMYKLAQAIGLQRVWIWPAAMMVPFVNLIMCIVLVEKGRGTIEAAGYKPGALGIGVRF